VDLNQVYSLTNGQFLEQVYALDNPFIRQLVTLATNEAKNLKVVSFVFKDKLNNRGEIAQKGMKAAEKSVIDICKLTPLVGGQGIKTLLDEVATYRANLLGFEQVGPTFAKDNADILMVDYLLASCLCYVEVFDNSANVEKFFATRNRFIAGGIVGEPPEATVKYHSYLQAYAANYQTRQLKVLKLSSNKTGFKIVQPRSFVDFNKSIKVTPLFLMTAFVEGVSEVLRNNIVRFRYIKDNLQERELISTLSPEILLTHYDQDRVQRVMTGVGSQLNRGYVKLPELGASKYDSTGTRSLNISRITSVDVIDTFDSRFIDVDFDTILPNFKETVNNLRNLSVIAMVHEDLIGQPIQTQNIAELRNIINSYVDGQYAMGTTTALRYIHTYMVQRAQIFNTYNGGKPAQYGSIGSGFNLGGAE
jgi:hypothetical protein